MTNEKLDELEALGAKIAAWKASPREDDALALLHEGAAINALPELVAMGRRVEALRAAAQEQLDYMDMCNDKGDLERNLRAALAALKGPTT